MHGQRGRGECPWSSRAGLGSRCLMRTNSGTLGPAPAARICQTPPQFESGAAGSAPAGEPAGAPGRARGPLAELGAGAGRLGKAGVGRAYGKVRARGAYPDGCHVERDAPADAPAAAHQPPGGCGTRPSRARYMHRPCAVAGPAREAPLRTCGAGLGPPAAAARAPLVGRGARARRAAGAIIPWRLILPSVQMLSLIHISEPTRQP
mgnify:CR=1 FL=1